MKQNTILLVDDEPNILKALGRLLLDFDFRVITAECGEKALSLLAGGEQPAVIISDQRMPGMTGSEFLAKAKGMAPDSVRIVLTGHADIDCAIDAVNHGGIMRYVLKPWNDDELRQIIKEAAEKYTLIQKNRELTIELQKKNQILEQLNQSLEKKVEERTRVLQKKMAELEARDRIQQHLLTCHPLEETLQLVLQEILQVAEMKSAAIFLLEKHGELKLAAIQGWEAGEPMSAIKRLQDSSVTLLLSEGKFVMFTRESLPVEKEDRSVARAAVPIRQGNQLLGLVFVEKEAIGPFSKEELGTISTFGAQAAIAIRDSQLREALPNLECSLDDLLHDLNN